MQTRERRIRAVLLAAFLFAGGLGLPGWAAASGSPPSGEGTPGTGTAPRASTAAAPTLTLSEAVALARRSSPVVLESRARSEAARQAGREAALNRLPTVTLRETAVRTDSPADAFGLQLMQERFSFPAFVASDPNKPQALDNFNTQIEATLPLFTGGQLAGGIRQAGRMAQAAQAMSTHTSAAVDLAVANAYLDALLADRFVELAEKARATTLQHVEKARDFFSAGMIVESDLLQAEVQLAKMEQNLIQAKNRAALARAGLNRVMGIEQDRSFRLEDAPVPADSVAGDSAASDSAVGGFAGALDSALRSRNDIHAVERQVAAAQAGIGRAQGDYWPQIGVSARYSWNDDLAFGGHGDSYTLAAMAQWQVGNWGQTRARVSRSRSDYQAALESQRSYKQQVEFEVRQATQGLEEARTSHEISLSAVRAAEKALSILEDRFGQGLCKMTDLLDAETMAHEARVRETQTRYDLEKSVRTLRFAVGLAPIPEVQS